ncbi:hypothetical protein AAEX28_12370 [Lentisphaerota bacterium WC36G]|nr:hypothetical protein LJT99_15200 [Lentisphaerae bacterium WC36]
MQFGQYLSELMTKYNVKVIEIADLINFKQAQVSKVRHGKALINIDQLKAIGNKLEELGATRTEMEILCDLFVSEKSGISFKELHARRNSNNELKADEILLLNNFRKLPNGERADIAEIVARKAWELESK